MSGYDKFFKDAKKASQSSSPKGQSNQSTGRFPIDSSSKRTERESQARPSRKQESPEAHLRRELAARMKAKRKQAIRRKQDFPLGPAVVVIAGFVLGGFLYARPETAEKLFGRIEIGLFGAAEAASGAKKAAAPSPDKSKAAAKDSAARTPAAESAEAAVGNPANPAASSNPAKGEGAPDVRGWSEEEMSFFKKLNERKQELDQRESELAKMEEELQKQKAELDEKIKQLESMRLQISQTLKTRVANDQEKVDKLVQFYSTMKPQQAAKVIETINEDLAVEVLDKMKKKNAAEIMNMMDAKKARKLSELLTGYQRTPASAASESSSAPVTEN